MRPLGEQTNEEAEELAQSFKRPPVELVDHDCGSEIGQFYAKRSVLVTGATGFVGKVREGRFQGAFCLAGQLIN